MEASYFYSFVLPLGIFVFVLASLVFYYAKREELAERKLKKLVRRYVKNRLKQKEIFEKESERLDELFQSKSIDEVTYERMKKILENSYEKRREEARTLFASFEKRK